MIYETYESYAYTRETRQLIRLADEIITDYSGQGFTLTLRQLYYQFVARDLIPNTERSYKKLGNVVTKGRMSGDLPWDGIEDRNRGANGWPVQESIESIVRAVENDYWADFWKDQDYYVEVWVEKDALSSVIERATTPFRVTHMACKGYLSASEAWRAGRRMKRAQRQGKQPVIVHLGDHDPSGLDMSRDNDDRANLFGGYGVELKRIALNMDQIELYDPPPNPAKLTDSRANDYVAEHGYTSWELDALEPSVIVDLVADTINPLITDRDAWEDAQRREDEGGELLSGIGEYWDEIEELIRDRKGL